MLQTRKSDPTKPPRVMIYGHEGVGKSTFGAKAYKPIFLSPEGGTDHLSNSDGGPVDELVGISTWDGLRAGIKNLMTEAHEFKTVVLDSADWIEGLAHAHIIGKSGFTIITVNKGYGAGYRQSQNMHQELIADLSELREKRNMSVIITAHAHVRAVKDPDSSHDYDAFEIKCHEQVSSLWREWCDALFFVRFRTFTKSSDETERARALTDYSRSVHAIKNPAYQAKNRYGMPPELDFTENFWSEFMQYAKKGVQTETVEQLLSEISELTDTVADEAIRNAVVDSTFKAGQDVARLTAIRARLKSIKGESK